MTPVIRLEPGMETLQSIGGWMDMAILQIVKHIRQSIIDEGYGAL
jgi:hypothetical protein